MEFIVTGTVLILVGLVLIAYDSIEDRKYVPRVWGIILVILGIICLVSQIKG